MRIVRLILGNFDVPDDDFGFRLVVSPASKPYLRECRSLCISEMGRVVRYSPCARSGTFSNVLVWHARANALSIPPRKRLNASGPTSKCNSVFSLLVYHLGKESTELPARVQALSDLAPRRLSDNATATWLHGGSALVITLKKSLHPEMCEYVDDS